MTTLLDKSSKILKGWAEKILTRKLSVSLEAITWNALRLAGLPAGESRDLEALGEYLIGVAEEVEGFALGQQALELAKLSLVRALKPIEDRFTAAFGRDAEVSFPKAARAITALKNSSDAGLRLREFLMWMRHSWTTDGNLQHALDKLLDQRRPTFSQAAIEILRAYYPLFKDEGFTTKRLESQSFGKRRKSAPDLADEGCRTGDVVGSQSPIY